MKIDNVRRLLRLRVILTALILMPACVQGDDFVDESGYADTTMTSRGISATGARYLRPPDNYADHPGLGQPKTIVVPKEEVLPREQMKALKRGLTEDEVKAMFGAPYLETYQAIDTDTGGEDWNARVLAWKFQDPDFSDVLMTRDLDLYFAEIDTQNPLPDRPELLPHTWVLIRWELN